MCGLVGIMTTGIATDRSLSILATLLFLDRARGEHATGLAKINPWKKEISIHKKAQSAVRYLAEDSTFEFLEKDKGRIYIGHNRYATMGDKKKDENAHPFQVDHITLAHNGSVDSWTLHNLEGHDDPDINVDSHMVCKTIADLGIEEAVKKFSGAFALTWWDDREHSLNFLRNGDRPLWMAAISDGTLMWASEREFMDALVLRKRNNLSYKEEPREIPVDTLISYKFNENGVLQNNGKCHVKELKFGKVVNPNPKTSAWESSYLGESRGGSHYSGYNAGRNYDARANGLLSMWKIPNKVGDTITFAVDKLDPTVNRHDRCNVIGMYQGVEVVSYFVEKTVVQGAKKLTGRISNCTEVTIRSHNDIEFKEIRIQLESNSLMRDVGKPAKKNVEVAVSIGPRFPLKVQGHTFQNRDSFVDFVSQGCADCGKVPTSYDVSNPLLTVYEKPGFNGMLKDCEFICGNCIADENKENVK